MVKIGLDVGSTTLKCVVLSQTGEILYQKYERHFSQIPQKVAQMLQEICSAFPRQVQAKISISGSGGMGFAEQMGIPFVQEVFATKTAVQTMLPNADVVIELGGEDAKILFLSGIFEVRMNGSCAGGTGAFIDQMATLLQLMPEELDELAKRHNKIYNIASRCGVFAKSDIQPLLNQGATKEDISASILAAVVNQTIAGLAQGRQIAGNIVYLGGPLTFLSQLRTAFDEALETTGHLPANSLYYVAIGASLASDGLVCDLRDLREKIALYSVNGTYAGCKPLFESEADYLKFQRRHGKAQQTTASLGSDHNAYLGIDAGSTTVKAVVINENEEIVFSRYLPNSGNPVPLVKDFLEAVYAAFPQIHIRSAATTGYGEEMIQNAFHADMGVVETMAHFTAAKKYDPHVDFILDIGGQDIKCFQIKNGAIDNIFLNEACSSGCGSFLQTFAGALGFSIEAFAKLGLFADRPVDLGSRCTVFMNSSVKQAQKEGATLANISAGLSISVVKNALYKVIRISGTHALGEHIVVQGGTFLNDAVLRSFEQETGKEVTRPPIAGMMGAYGAALYAKENCPVQSTLLTAEQLTRFQHRVRAVTCKGCTNHCMLTVNTFDGGRTFIGGNQCEKPRQTGRMQKESYNLFEEKRLLLSAYSSCLGERETIGLPMGLNFFELLPFWHTFFRSLGFGVRLSPASSKRLYQKGQNSIPSDTVCYPAKLMHGHIEELVESGVDAIFYPCMTYNFDEGLGNNHYNCPIVAYYPEVIAGNMQSIRKTILIKDYVGPHNREDFPKKIRTILNRTFGPFSLKQIKTAADAAYAEYARYLTCIQNKGAEYLAIAKEKGLPVIVLAGRPYHLDAEINHGIDKLICESGAVLVSEDGFFHRGQKVPVNVLNQWTYHARLYSAARAVTEQTDLNINLVQLVSFGCGIDAVTTDEIRSILEASGKIYTQIKIDEITNLGAVRIRLRSLFTAVKQKERQKNCG